MVKNRDSRYKLSPLAEADLLSIFLHGIEQWGTTQAESYAIQITEALQLLSESPGMGREREEIYPNARSYLVGSHIIFYKHNKDVIEISRVLRQRMDETIHLK